MNVLVALETTANPKYAVRRSTCETTWGSRMPEGYFFESFDGARLGVDDSYRGLCQKTKAICQYARDSDYEWLIIVDDDTFVRTDRLEIPDADYAGHCLPKIPDGSINYCAGAFYWLSRKAFSIVAEGPFRADLTSAEDQWVGWTLANNGIIAKKLPEVVLHPCECGICKPDPVPHEWVAYCMWQKFSPDLFARFERNYGLTAKP